MQGKEVEVMIQITHIGFLVVVDGVILPKYISKDTGLYTAYYKQQFLNTLDIINSMCTELWKLCINGCFYHIFFQTCLH